MSAPLVLSVDLTDTAMLDRVWPILSNLEVIAVNQHWAGSPGQLLLTDASVFPSKLSASGYYSYPGTLGQCDTSATFPSHPLYSRFTRGPLMVMVIVMVNAAMLQCCNGDGDGDGDGAMAHSISVPAVSRLRTLLSYFMLTCAITMTHNEGQSRGWQNVPGMLGYE